MIPELWKKARLRREGRVTQKSIIAFWDNPIYPPREIEGGILGNFMKLIKKDFTMLQKKAFTPPQKFKFAIVEFCKSAKLDPLFNQKSIWLDDFFWSKYVLME